MVIADQAVAPGDRGEGPESLSAIVDQLEGFEAATGAWEGEILPARLAAYEPEWLDSLCLTAPVFSLREGGASPTPQFPGGLWFGRWAPRSRLDGGGS